MREGGKEECRKGGRKRREERGERRNERGDCDIIQIVIAQTTQVWYISMVEFIRRDN